MPRRRLQVGQPVAATATAVIGIVIGNIVVLIRGDGNSSSDGCGCCRNVLVHRNGRGRLNQDRVNHGCWHGGRERQIWRTGSDGSSGAVGSGRGRGAEGSSVARAGRVGRPSHSGGSSGRSGAGGIASASGMGSGSGGGGRPVERIVAAPIFKEEKGLRRRLRRGHADTGHVINKPGARQASGGHAGQAASGRVCTTSCVASFATARWRGRERMPHALQLFTCTVSMRRVGCMCAN
jgi:hypothetical protein